MLTRDFKVTVIERAKRDPKFVECLLDEAESLRAEESETAREILGILIEAIGADEVLAAHCAQHSERLKRITEQRS